MIITATYVNSLGVYLALRGIHITNNSNINIRNIIAKLLTVLMVLYSASLTTFAAVVWTLDVGSGTYQMEHKSRGLLQPQHFIEAEELMERYP